MSDRFTINIDGRSCLASARGDGPGCRLDGKGSRSRPCATTRGWSPPAPAASAWWRSRASAGCSRPAPGGSAPDMKVDDRLGADRAPPQRAVRPVPRRPPPGRRRPAGRDRQRQPAARTGRSERAPLALAPVDAPRSRPSRRRQPVHRSSTRSSASCAPAAPATATRSKRSTPSRWPIAAPRRRSRTAGERGLLDTSCELCGGCIDTCPTGALIEKKAPRHRRLTKCEQVRTTCNFCGVGCQVDLHVHDGRVVKVDQPAAGRDGQRRQSVRQGPLRLRLHPPRGPPDRRR